ASKRLKPLAVPEHSAAVDRGDRSDECCLRVLGKKAPGLQLRKRSGENRRGYGQVENLIGLIAQQAMLRERLVPEEVVDVVQSRSRHDGSPVKFFRRRP